MNQSGAKHEWTCHGYKALYRPVWASTWRAVESKGHPIYFTTPLAAEVVAWRKLYETEQRVMRRDGEIVFAARAAAEGVFRKGRAIEVENVA